MIAARNITYKAGNKILVDDISVDFEQGKLNLIIGPNGAGKSTLIKLLSGQLQPFSGQVLYAGKPVGDYSIAQLARLRAVLSQSQELSFPLKVWEVVMMGRYPHFIGKPEEKDRRACDEALSLFDISNMADRDYTTLSGGERQRVHFARVLAQIWYPVEEQCRYLLLDEPLTFLDVHYQYQFMNQVADLLKKENLVVIGVVHDLNLASKFADKIILLHEGKLLSSGSAADVLTVDNIKTAYHIEPHIMTLEGKQYLFF